jgi:hypothetical protein
MKKFRKKQVMLILIFVLAIILVLFLRTVPIRTFYYQTSTTCNSNLYGGGNTEYSEYRMLGGGLEVYRYNESELKSLKVPQSGCNGPGLAPVDYTTIKLYVL